MADAVTLPDGPKRIQRKRTKGWRMPEGAVYVGRGTRWGNPFAVGWQDARRTEWRSRERCVDLFRFSMCRTDRGGVVTNFEMEEIDLNPIRGKDLACWCPLVDKDGNHVPCHADVLLELANV